jgi:hypothetical protein
MKGTVLVCHAHDEFDQVRHYRTIKPILTYHTREIATSQRPAGMTGSTVAQHLPSLAVFRCQDPWTVAARFQSYRNMHTN